jgi:putative CocE/NonD family hydrolase
MGPFDGSPSSGNIWRTAESWPPVSAKMTALYLTPDHGLQTEMPFEGIFSYLYDPNKPISTLGGRNLFLESGPKDQRSIEDRDDILVFTSEPLEEEVEITGSLSAKLFIASDRQDTDIVVRLTDVYPDGRSILIADGVYRFGVMCYRSQPEGLTPPSSPLIYPSDHIISLNKIEPIQVDIDLGPTSLVFAKGHSIRVSISSSNYPRYEKNLNIGLIGNYSGHFHIAKNTLFMGSRYPSQIILPIVEKKIKSIKEETILKK